MNQSTKLIQKMKTRSFRVSIIRDGNEMAHELVWADQKGPISKLVRIDVVDYGKPED